jgi:predicted  nucleic acid-binding Zn-ribbon protein
MRQKKSSSVKTEAEDLNLHVQLCTERYNALEGKIHAVENKLNNLESKVSDLNKTLQSNFLEIKLAIEKANNKRDVQVIATIGTIVVSIIGAITIYVRH